MTESHRQKPERGGCYIRSPDGSVAPEPAPTAAHETKAQKPAKPRRGQAEIQQPTSEEE